MQRAGTPLGSTEGCICRPARAPPPSWKGRGELLTRMLGSLSECLARAMASSVTLVSPLAWISRTAIWGQGQVTQGEGQHRREGGGELAGRGSGATTSSAHIPKEKMSTAVPSATSANRENESGPAGRMRGAGRRRALLDSPPYSGGKKCRFRGSSRSARMGLRRSSGSATGSVGDERTGRLHGPPSPRGPTHHWRRCGATLRRPEGRKSGVNAVGRWASSALGSRRSPSPALLPCPAPPRPAPPAPEPILMRPLCCMKIVSLVRFPWMMGGLQACRKLRAR